MHGVRILLVSLLLGCDGRFGQRVERTVEDASVATDAFAVDSFVPSPLDTAAPPTRLSCDIPVPDGFRCQPAVGRPGSAACTEAMLAEFVTCFGVDFDSVRCTKASAQFPECKRCVLETWIFENQVNSGACLLAIDPKSHCGQAWRCTTECLNEVCADCDTTPGSGTDAKTSERDDCERRAQIKGTSETASGPCAGPSLELRACREEPRFAPCFVASKEELLRFYRGACRDNGDWSGATDAGAPDAGSD